MPGTPFNVAGNPAGDQTWELDARNIMFRVDHSFTPNFRIEPQLLLEPAARRSATAARSAAARPSSSARPSRRRTTTTIGDGFYQRISTHHAHQQFDWIIRNNLLNHSTVAWDRWFMGGNSLSAGVGWPQQLWGANQGGLLDNTAGPPVIHLRRQHPLHAVGQNWPRFGF